ncbi:MAG: secondary thiamine-phosphate synthase [Candidatus Sedimenticola endophacoides]|uniref:Secondary thiamine-phosphate synthase n=2 Tax=Candidatus Sedimenticola endophacoides TaxID=2548426 RepID=A0A657PVV7_9GAMM|nr:MAG: secondary thiamine-phosphate synthase [Candidatus Sedimenticola endophacoides]OQX35550.1 MAG: secondary thiamine-phosphate synthase [Candidatus Sedimenticola endophacoides]OQX40481.1 MAG: secondary thiamine-phosphate synthase [Candidatus Sedimenticola endophacoides]OQX44452.1 MAG: secondary thiamine-phosphate synthase [Candidatus Sedimenticola endophacoides]OQX44836.1 MAG: secondary thiamine-phosphate synthase [Candidatus Sedimenticola endophacoides]
MRSRQVNLGFDTRGRGTREITREVQEAIAGSGIRDGLCHIFIQHTSASLVLCENADPSVRHDLETFMARLAPDGDPVYRHSMEGPDDMPAHIRSILSNMDLTVPVHGGRAALGTWQGVYLWEHRTHAHHRRVVVTVQGE